MHLGFHNVLRPEAFHGHKRRAPFFEGWYYKLVDARREQRLALIPGMYRASDPAQSHAFLQVFDGRAQRAWYQRFDLDDFAAHPRAFELAIGMQEFSRERISLDIDEAGLRLKGHLELGPGVGWPVRAWSPGVMGPFAWIPFLECYHGLLSFDHAIGGELELNGERLDFSEGRGYIEKDWGSSFPASWIWSQCNHFSRPGVSLSASIARIPNLGRTFPGFIVGLWLDGQLHAFTTHNASKVEVLSVDEAGVRWTLRNRKSRLELRLLRGSTTPLPGPTIEGMRREVNETLDARVCVRLSRLRDNVCLFEDEGECAGLEIQGDTDSLAP